ncbi:hypothetical protein [Rummeliibacillus stabekisii]|uniref:hypothetical protein n=1 Tax=Rummeliibacillus stabekisii TaxID=241244 RepID=UPI003720DFD7
MDTLGKILNCYSEVYSPHKQASRSFKSNLKAWGLVLTIFIIEVILMFYFLLIEKNWHALFMLVIYYITVGIASYWDVIKKEEVYGSMQNFDERKLKYFCNLVLDKTQINLLVANENQLVEDLLKTNLNCRYKKEETKTTISLGLFTTILIPFVIKLFSDNKYNETFLVLFCVIIGIVIIIFSTIQFIKVYYSTVSKLEHIDTLLKEISFMQLRKNKRLLNNKRD